MNSGRDFAGVGVLLSFGDYALFQCVLVLGVEVLCVPPNSYVVILIPSTSSVALFGNRVVANVVKMRSCCGRVGH